ncbi:MAG TPA: tetratricopeptide repeat protein [Herpetosiphonaceae bacterium]
MGHPFGDRIRQHLSRKHGLSQSRLGQGVDLDAAVISAMCRGQRLTGPLARERVLKIIAWFQEHNVLATRSEANDLLVAAKMAPLQADAADALERRLAEMLPETVRDTDPAEPASQSATTLASNTAGERLLMARSRYRAARKAFSARDYVQAESLLREVVAIDRDSSSYLGLLGRVLVRNAKFEEAISCLTAALELTQVNHIMYGNNRGIAYRLLGQYGKALDDFKVSNTKNPRLTLPLRLKSMVWLHLGHLENALQDIDRAIELKPTYLCGYSIRSIILNARGDTQEAIRVLEIAETMTTQDEEEFYCLSLAHSQLKHDEKALQYLRIAANMEPKYRNWAPFEPLLKPISTLPEFHDIIKAKPH